MDNKLSILIKGKLDITDLTQDKINEQLKNLKINLKGQLDTTDLTQDKIDKKLKNVKIILKGKFDATSLTQDIVDKQVKKFKVNLGFQLDKSTASIEKFRKDLEILSKKFKLNLNVNVNGNLGSSGTGGSNGNNKNIFPQNVEDQIKRINNSLDRLKINKDKVFADSRVSAEVAKLKEMENAFRRGEISARQYGLQLDTLRTRVAQVSGQFRNSSRDGYAFSQMLTLAAKKIAIWGISTNLVYGSLNQLKLGISYIYELDNSLNQIRIVTNKTQAEVESLAQSYNKLGKEMSVTTKEIAGTSADLFRQGLSESDVEKRMKSIIQYAKISSLSLKESNTIITATANATGEDVQKIIDIFALLGDTTASGANEIGEALQRVASASENSNISLEKSASWLATISSITRESSSTIGRSLNSVISRYESIKKTGFNSDDETQLNDVVKALDDIGIKATDSQGQLLDFATVMDMVGAKFGSLEKNEKAYIATTMFGTFQRNRGITLLNNYSDSLKNYENALNASGTAESKFNVYQESTSAKFDKLKNSVEGFWQSTLDSSLIKGTLDGLSYLIDAFGNLTTIIMSVTAVLALLKGTQITSALIAWATSSRTFGLALTDNIRLMIISKGAMAGYTEQMLGSAIATRGLTLAMHGLNVAIKSNPIGFIIGAITTAIVVFDIWKQKQKENAREAEELTQKLNQERESLVSLKSEYEKIIKSGDLTSESKARLKSIQDELIKTYGTEAKDLDLVSGKYEKQIGIIDKLAVAKAREQLASMGNSGEEALAKSKNVSTSKLYVGHSVGKKVEIDNILNSIAGDFDGQKGSKDILELNGTLEERVAILEKLSLAIGKVSNKDSFAKTIVEDISAEYNKLNAELKEVNKKLGIYIPAKNIIDFADAIGDSSEKVEELKAKLAKDPTNQGLIKELEDIHNQTELNAKDKGTYEDLKDAIGEFFKIPDANDASEKINNLTNSISNMDKAFKDGMSTQKNYTDLLQKMKNGEELTAEELVELAEKHKDLLPYIHKVNNGFTIEIDALEDLRKQSIKTRLQTIADEKKKSEDVLKESEKRIKQLGLEKNAMAGLSNTHENITSVLHQLILQEMNKTGKSYGEVYNGFEKDNTYGALYNLADAQSKIDEANKKADLYTKALEMPVVATKKVDIPEVVTGPYAELIRESAKQNGISATLLDALIKQESGFRAKIVSPSGAVGLTQLMPATAKSLGVSNSYDPAQNIEGGAKYLKQQLDKFGGDISLALAAYNAGPGAVTKYGGIPPYAETQNYVKSVLGDYNARKSNETAVAEIGDKKIEDPQTFKDTTDAIIKEINAQNLLTKTKSDSIQKEVEQAKSQEEYILTLSKTNELIASQELQLTQLQDAKAKINAETPQGYWRWFTEDNEESLTFQSEWNESSNATRTSMEALFTKIQKLRKAWVENKNATEEATDSQKQLQSTILDINYDIVKSDLTTYNKSIESISDSLSLLKSEQDQYSQSSSQYSDNQKQQIELLKQKSEAIQSEIDHLQILIATTNLTASAQEELQSTLTSLYSSLSSTKSETLSIYNSIADSIINTFKRVYEKQKDIAISKIEDEMDYEDKRHEKKLDNLDKEMQKYQDAYDEKMKLINDEANAEDYNLNLTNAQKDAQKIQNDINILSLDDSIEAKFKREELETQLADKITEIEKMQKDHSRDLRKDALSEQLDDYKTDIDAKKDSEESKYKSIKENLDKQKTDTEYMYNELINDERKYASMRLAIISGNTNAIKSQMSSFLSDFKDMNKSTARSLGESWNDLLDLIDEVKSASKSVDDIKDSKSESSAKSSKINVYGNSIDIGLAKSVNNADKFNFITVNNGDASSAKSGDIVLGGSAVIPNIGQGERIWGDDRYETLEKFKKKTEGFKTGGVNNVPGMTMLHGTNSSVETIFNATDGKKLWDIVHNLPSLSTNLMSNIKLPDYSNILKQSQQQTMEFKFDNLIHVEGNVDAKSLPSLEKIAKYTINELNKTFNRSGVFRK